MEKCGHGIIYVINSFEFKETNVSFSHNLSLRKVEKFRLDTIYMIDSFEFKETSVSFSHNLSLRNVE